VWTAVEEPLALERSDVALALPVPGWLVSGTRADGVVRVVNHGTDHADERVPGADDPGYARHAYATHAGPEYGPAARYSPLDSHVGLVGRDGLAAHRSPLVPLGVRGRVGASRHRAHWPTGPLPEQLWPARHPEFRAGPWISTASALYGAVEVRLARVDAAGDGSGVHGGGWVLRIGGYPLAAEQPPQVRVVDGQAEVWRPDGLRSAVVGLHGLPQALVHRGDGTNAFGRHSAVPVVATGAPVVFGRVYAAAVILTGDPIVAPPRGRVGGARLRQRPAPAALPRVVLDPEGPGIGVLVEWPDGETDHLRLDPPDGCAG
jgi:hypothetical protein